MESKAKQSKHDMFAGLLLLKYLILKREFERGGRLDVLNASGGGYLAPLGSLHPTTLSKYIFSSTNLNPILPTLQHLYTPSTFIRNESPSDRPSRRNMNEAQPSLSGRAQSSHGQAHTPLILYVVRA